MDPAFQHLSGITIQRLEKPKPKPEPQIPPPAALEAAETNSSFEFDDEESSDESIDTENAIKRIIDTAEVHDHILNVEKPGTVDSASLNKRFADFTEFENFTHNFDNSVRFEKSAGGKRVIDTNELLNFKRNIGDSVTIDKPSAFGKRVIDSSNIQNFKRIADSTLTDRAEVSKRVISSSEVLNLKQNLNDSITIDRPVGKRVIDVSEVQNFKRNFGDSTTVNRLTVGGKRVIDSSELFNFARNIGDSITPDNFPTNKRIIDSREIQNLKYTPDDSVKIDRPTVNKRVLDFDSFQNIKNNFGNFVSTDRSAVDVKQTTDDSVVIGRPVIDSKSALKSTTVQSLQRNQDEFAIDDESPDAKFGTDSSEEQDYEESLDDSNKADTFDVNKQILSSPEAQSFNQSITDFASVYQHFSNSRDAQLSKQNKNDYPSFDKPASTKRVLNTNEILNFKRNLDDSVTIDRSTPKLASNLPETYYFKQGLEDSITIGRPASGKRALNTTEVPSFKESFEEFPISKPTSGKHRLDSTEVQNFKLGLDSVTFERPPSRKHVLDSPKQQNFGQTLDDLIAPDTRTSAKSILEFNETSNSRRNLDNSATYERPTLNKRILDSTEVHNLEQIVDASVTAERPISVRRVLDSTEVQNIKRTRDDSITIERPAPPPKRILNSTELQNFRRGLDGSVSLERPAASKRVLDTNKIQQFMQGLDNSRTGFVKRVIDSTDVHDFNRGLESSVTFDRSTGVKRIIDSTELQNFKQNLNDSVAIDKPTVDKRILDSTEVYSIKPTFDNSDEDLIETSEHNSEDSLMSDESSGSRHDASSEVQLHPSKQDVDNFGTSNCLRSDKDITISNEHYGTDQGTFLKDDQFATDTQNFNDVPTDTVDVIKPCINPNETPCLDDLEKAYNLPSDFTEFQNLKRSFDDPVTSENVLKKVKTSPNEISVTEKPTNVSTVPSASTSFSDVPTDEEMSEFGSESDFGSESELDSDIAAIKREAAASFSTETNIEAEDPSFLQKLVDDSFLDKTIPDVQIKTEIDTGDNDDYDYDIKEKLKEMGEISFETVKKGDKSKKGDGESEISVSKKGVEDDVVIERKGPGGGIISSSMMRRNIREVMDEAKLDQSTLAAQREEMERLQRVQEQQRIIRDVQRQMAQERMQNKVLSLLQGGSLSKTGSSGTRIGNTVLVKLPNGETKSVTKPPKPPYDLVKLPRGQLPFQKQGNLPPMMRPPGSAHGQLTPSVSIAPVAKRMLPPSRLYNDGDEYEDFRMRGFPRGRPHKPSTLTTADAASDDDCIVVSDTEAEQSLEDEVIEDPSNSGMHTNDEFNQPDDLGRVVINIGHPEGESDLYIAPQIARIIKPHQIGGVRFLYDNVIESINRFDSSTGFGCILAHSMGLGKTLQVICFSDIFLRHTSAKTILCIMPINTLQNWLAEYNMWLPAEEDASDCALGAQGEVRPRTFSLYVLNDSHKTITSRAKVVQAWKSSGGVLLIGYEQYRLLSLRKQPKSRRKPHLVQPDDDVKNRKLLDDIHTALVMPGPDLVICDEGHRIKNSHASISQALKQMRTKRRVVLTGYPLQNNLMEYWCMVDFVRPNYLGTKAEFCNMFERPIQNGQCMDSTETDIKLMRYRAHVLHSLLLGFVQRRSHEVLQNALPQKEEYVLLLRMTDFQRKLYNVFMNEVVRCQSVPNPLKAFAVCCKIWNHPDVLYNFLKKRAGGEAVDIDLEEVSNTSNLIVNPPPSRPKRMPKRTLPSRGKRSVKPEASVTPNNTREEEKTPPRIRRGHFISPNPGPDSSEFFLNENANFPSPSISHQHSPSSSFISSQTSDSNHQPSFANQNFSQSSLTSFSNFSSSTSQASTSSFQNIKQQLNMWGQKEVNEHSGSPSKSQLIGGDVVNSTNSSEGLSLRKDDKPIISSNIITSTRKSELNSVSVSENKPKINIISDIKVEAPFPNFLNKAIDSSKKINIISDIKVEPKKDESGEDKRFSRFNMESMKNELKPLAKPEPPPRRISEDEDVKIISEMPPPAKMRGDDGQDGIPYDWAIELLKDYIPGCIGYSAKTEVLFCIIRESISLGDRLLLFSQSLITLDVIEQFLQTNNVPGEVEKWAKNTNYYRLDGSTSALEREKLINEFNSNPKIHLFLVSTRAGSLGINLVGANRVVVFDASWNPCHDTQAVCRVYRYGQRKPCFVYRFVMDHCLEKKIYDRQINKQGMSDRVVDECNPDSHVTMKDLSTLCFDDTNEGELKDWSCVKDNYVDTVLQKVLEKYGYHFNKQPFQHESLLVDRKDKQLSQQEKRLAKKGYEREKQASRQPAYSAVANARNQRPVASVRPMLQGGERPSRWIPAEHWQRQGMTAQEMTLPLDVVIPTNQPDKSNIILKAGQKVLVLKSPKGVYMQLENGKIVAIKTAIKVRGKAEEDAAKFMKPGFPSMKPPPPLHPPGMSMLPPKRMVRPFTPGHGKLNMRSIRQPIPNLLQRMQGSPRMQGLPRMQSAPGMQGPVGMQSASGMQGPVGMQSVPSIQGPAGMQSTPGMQGPAGMLTPSRKPGPVVKGPPYPVENEASQSPNLLKPDTESKKLSLPSELTQRLMGDEITMERFSARSERRPQTKADLSPQTSLLKNIQQKGAISISSQKPRSSTVQQLEQSTSSLISETKQRIQDINEISSSYHEDEKASASDSSSVAPVESDEMQDPDETEDIEDLDESFEDEELNDVGNSDMNPEETDIKTEGSPSQTYGYGGYYGYNQPYPHPQPYGTYPPHQPPPPYDYAYGQPQQPPYNYGMYPQGYPPPQYPIPPQPYDPYAPHPPQPMYGGYHPPYPQQYPPPPPTPYPTPGAPPPPPHTYPDYQYSTPPPSQATPPSSNSNYYQNTKLP